MVTSPSLHQPVHFSFFCLGSGSRCTQPWAPLCTAEACRICSRLPKQRCCRISERPYCTKRKWMGRTLILEGWHSWHAVLGDILFAELLTLQGPLFQAATVSYHLFYFPVSWYAFRNLNCSRKGKSITRFSGKIYGMCSPSPNYVCICFCLLLSCAHTLWSDDIAENPQEMVAESKLKPSIEVFYFLPQPTFIIAIAIFSYGV